MGSLNYGLDGQSDKLDKVFFNALRDRKDIQDRIMSKDFYSKLFTYKARPGREPLEDFLSELFCELLNTIAVSQHAKVIGDLLNLSDLGYDWSNISWCTQFSIDRGRCDLVGKTTGNVQESAFIIIENKIGAGFTAGSGGDEEHQLERYLKYIRSRSEKNKALILISLYSFPSVSILPPNNMISWRYVARNLDQLLSALGERQSCLASQLFWFVNFMRGYSMTEVNISLQDIASMTAWKRLERSCRILGGETARQALGGLGGLQDKLNSSGIFQPSGYGNWGNPGNFNGVIFTPRKNPESNCGTKSNESNFLVWAGILLDETDKVQPIIQNVPEFTLGIGLWVDKDDASRAETAMAPLYKVLLGIQDWSQTKYSSNESADVFVIRRSKPFSIVYDENIDWVDYARNFYINAASDLLLLDDVAWTGLLTFAADESDKKLS